jgi:ATP-binding cassette subfamily C (CFTR/MRP) protein 4
MARNGYKKISTNEDKEIVSFVSLLLFQWMNSIFKIGSERPLDENDFLPLSKENSASFLTDQLQANWNKETTKCNRNEKRPKLWKSVIKLPSVKDVMIIIFTGALNSISRLLQPVLLGYLISILISAEPQKDNQSSRLRLRTCFVYKFFHRSS